MDKKSAVKPMRSFVGRSLPKSFALCREVRMARNMTTAVSEKQSTPSDDVENTLNMRCAWRTRSPLLSVPTGMLSIVAKAIVAMSAAMMVHEFEVFISHSVILH
ncbi:hypothetical protein LOK49_LG15G00481 [Camellia lanceoleosa]|uniref:Uncharacterized protein n=1 Tax=Camellia lanceoleosa TaxID=1840588 RepID=A0ACC0F595_9ERIC|nr:hypothetical protein LOK49_LG15G00481 [Camellia lanceoleosa]